MQAESIDSRFIDRIGRGNLFSACNQAVQALSVNSTTATGLILTNPTGSGVIVVLLEVCIAPASAPAAAAQFILCKGAGAVTHTTPLTPQNLPLGGSKTPAALADSAATVPATTIVRPFGGGPVATGSVNSAFIKDDVSGAISLAPGTCVSLQALTTAISAVASMVWMEIPVIS